MKYRSTLNKLTFVFFILLILLTFFSQTLSDMRLPRVALEFSSPGIISPAAHSSGIVHPAEVDVFFSPANGRIVQIAEVGDSISQDKVLFSILVNVDTLGQDLFTVEEDLRIAALNIERIQAERAAGYAYLAQIINEPVSLPQRPSLALFEYDITIEAITNELEHAEENLRLESVLYNQGLAPRQNIINMEAEIKGILLQVEQSKLRREAAIANYYLAVALYYEAVDAAGHALDSRIQMGRNRISQLDFTYRAQVIETERLERRLYDLVRQIEEGGLVEIHVPVIQESGADIWTVTEIYPGLAPGAIVQEGIPILRAFRGGSGFVIEASFHRSHDFIWVGQNMNISVGSDVFTGLVSRVVPRGDSINVTIFVQAEELIGGELAFISNLPVISHHTHVIPLSALREDDIFTFILYLEVEEGWIGQSYVLRRRNINVSRLDNEHVAIIPIIGGAIPENPIVINSDVPVHAGNRVRVVSGMELLGLR